MQSPNEAIDLKNPAPTPQAHDRICVVRDQGLWLLGVVRVGGDGTAATLFPAFEFGVQAVQQPNGQTLVRHVAQPLLLIPTMDEWNLSPGSQAWPIEGLGHNIAQQLRATFDEAKAMSQGMRAAAAGLHIAREMPRGRIQ